MNILLTRRGNALLPYGDEALDAVKAFPLDGIFNAKITRVRNYEHHKGYFAMVHQAWEFLTEKENAEFGSENNFRKFLQVEAGYFDLMVVDDVVLKFPKSVSFESLGEDEFSELHQRVLDVIFYRYGERMNEEDILRFNDFGRWKTGE